MGVQLTDNAEALRLFFTDDVYLIGGDMQVQPAEQEVFKAVEPLVAQEPVAEYTRAERATSTVPDINSAPLADVAPLIPVIAVPSVDPVVDKSAKTFKSMGKNQKNVLILVNDDQYDVSSDRGRELLRNIVKAIQLSANDFALVNYSSCGNAQFTELVSFFSSRFVLVFGVSPARIGLTTDHQQNNLVMEGNIQLVFSDNLDLLAVDQNSKKTLWGSIKQLAI